MQSKTHPATIRSLEILKELTKYIMPSYNITQSKHSKSFIKNLVPFSDEKTMKIEEDMSLKDRVELILKEMTGREHGKKAKLARIAGCSGPVINHWLNDKQQEMNFEHAQRIASSLGYRVGWLMTGKGPRRPGPGEELLQDGLDFGTETEVAEHADASQDPENDLYIKVSAEELKLITRYRNATKVGKAFIEMASINAPKEVPGKH
jgi:hypothetical protein